MAVDKLVDSTQLDADLTSVANAIRLKTGDSSPIAFPSGFVSEIGKISGQSIPDVIPKVGDSNAHIYVYLPNENDLTVTIWVSVVNRGKCKIDWGDGAINEIEINKPTHTYEETGFYHITLESIQTGSTKLALGQTGNTYLLGGFGYPDLAGNSKLIGLEIGSDWQTASAGFLNGSNIMALYAKDCYAVAYGGIRCDGSHFLRVVELPDAQTSLNSSYFNNCTSLTSIVIPAQIDTIGTNCFQNCGKLDLHMESSTPPTLNGSTAFNGDDITIFVPQGALAAYQEATNWSTYAEYIVEEAT